MKLHVLGCLSVDPLNVYGYPNMIKTNTGELYKKFIITILQHTASCLFEQDGFPTVNMVENNVGARVHHCPASATISSAGLAKKKR